MQPRTSICSLYVLDVLDHISLITFCSQGNCQVFVIGELKLDNPPLQGPLSTSQITSTWGDLIFTFQYLILMSCQKAF